MSFKMKDTITVPNHQIEISPGEGASPGVISCASGRGVLNLQPRLRHA
jgi:hypothetical protein